MPIVNIVEGDLIALAQAGKYRAIVHGCNTHCRMGAGIAPQIAKAWPEAEKADNQTVQGNEGKLGKYSYHYDRVLGMTIFNAYTQHSFRNKPDGSCALDYQALGECFKTINNSVRSWGRNHNDTLTNKVGIPMIGAGLAGGHWEAIETIINLVTPDIDIELVVYKP